MKTGNFLSSFGKAFDNLKISKNFKFWLIAPIVVLVAAMIVVSVVGGLSGSATDGFNIGIDFEGGTLMSVKFGTEAFSSDPAYAVHVDAVTSKIEEFGVRVSYVQSSESGVRENSTINFRYKNISDDDAQIAALNIQIQNAIKELYPSRAVDDDFIKAESIGKTASSELINKAVLALVISTVLIMIYIVFRFEAVSGISAVIIILHDVIVMFALTVIFRVQINSSYIAAAITIIAYSINNTIIVFDRCRELMRPYKGKKGVIYEDIGDSAVKNTFRRTLYTTLTTFITVFFLAILGSASLREFTIPIIIGLIVGLYSSIFLATPIWSRFSYVAESIREKRLERKKAVYQTVDEEGNIVEKEIIEEKPEKLSKTKPAQKTYKYRKKNTTFKK